MIYGNTRFNEKIGSELRKIRLSKGLPLIEVAARCNMEKTNLSRIELGKTNINLNTLQRIAIALDVEVEIIFKPINDP